MLEKIQVVEKELRDVNFERLKNSSSCMKV